MKATGIVRRIDDLGRIVIPKEIRERIFGTRNCEGKPMELFMDGDSIVLRKYEDAEMRKEKEIRAKAIDEFAERLLDNAPRNFAGGLELGGLTCYLFANKVMEIAEQLKGDRNE